MCVRSGSSIQTVGKLMRSLAVVPVRRGFHTKVQSFRFMSSHKPDPSCRHFGQGIGKTGKSGKSGRGGKSFPCTFRRRSKTPCRRRSPSSPCRRSPSHNPRFASRSPSQKQPAPRRLTPAPSAPSATEAVHAKDAELKAKAAEPSFRDFVLKHASNEDSPEFVMNRFQQYIHERLKEELQAIKQTGLFFDLYHPLSRLRRYELRLGTTQLNAATFAQDRVSEFLLLGLAVNKAGSAANPAVLLSDLVLPMTGPARWKAWSHVASLEYAAMY